MSEAPELLPCPFCGSDCPQIGDEGIDLYVGCRVCGAWVGLCSTEDDAIAEWNTRKPPPLSAALALPEVKALVAVGKLLAKMEASIRSDVQSAHSRRIGATEWMKEDDREFRGDLRAAFAALKAALAAIREVSDGQ